MACNPSRTHCSSGANRTWHLADLSGRCMRGHPRCHASSRKNSAQQASLSIRLSTAFPSWRAPSAASLPLPGMPERSSIQAGKNAKRNGLADRLAMPREISITDSISRDNKQDTASQQGFMMKILKPKTSHPVVLFAAIALTAISIVGSIALAGLIPASGVQTTASDENRQQKK